MYFISHHRQMLNYSVLSYTVLSFTFIFNICIFCHTVAHSSDFMPPHQNESLSNEIKDEQFKRGDKKQDNVEVEIKNRNITSSENKAISSNLINATVFNKPVPIEDEFNTTASFPKWMKIDDNAFKRTGIVAVGLMSIVLIFFVIKAVRLRQKRSKSRKYGIITSTASDMEMEPLDKDDEEEEDTTLFDAQHKYSLQ